MDKKYFVYGTLMQDEVLSALGLKKTMSEPCKIMEMTLYVASNGRYPLMVETFDPRDSVSGLLVSLELTNPNRNMTVEYLLDFYEGAYGENPLYHRIDTGQMIYYLANRGNPYVMTQLVPENHIGGDWFEFQGRRC